MTNKSLEASKGAKLALTLDGQELIRTLLTLETQLDREQFRGDIPSHIMSIIAHLESGADYLDEARLAAFKTYLEHELAINDTHLSDLSDLAKANICDVLAGLYEFLSNLAIYFHHNPLSKKINPVSDPVTYAIKHETITGRLLDFRHFTYLETTHIGYCINANTDPDSKSEDDCFYGLVFDRRVAGQLEDKTGMIVTISGYRTSEAGNRTFIFTGLAE